MWRTDSIQTATETSANDLAKFVARLKFDWNSDQAASVMSAEQRQEAALAANALLKRLADPDTNRDRREEQLCQACYFLPKNSEMKLAMADDIQISSETGTCANCGQTLMKPVGVDHPDRLCYDCAQSLACCTHCGGEMN